MNALQISIIGTGRVGSTLACALYECGHKILAVNSRRLESAKEISDIVGAKVVDDPVAAVQDADVVLLTVPDGVIRQVCEHIAVHNGFRKGSVVFHASGALSSHVLDTAKECGAYIGSLHPLQSFANRTEGLKNLPGTFFVLEGDDEAVKCGSELVTQLGGRLINISTQAKALYHAGACAASNYLVSVVCLGVSLFEAAGIPVEDGLSALLPLIEGTCRNIRTLGVPAALTGPISRGDSDTIRRHLDAIQTFAGEYLPIYSELARYTVKVASSSGSIGPDVERDLLEALDF